MLTVACVYKPGNGFTKDYVSRLRDGVAEHCKAPYRFVCLGGDTPLRFKNRPGFWNKLELFALPGPVVYVDLDCIIRNDVTDLFTYSHEFTVLDNWLHPAEFNSGFMAWNGKEDLRYLLDYYDAGTPDAFGGKGDQGYVQRFLKRPFALLSTLFPDRVISYKLHVKPNNRVAPNASIVMFHGRPRPHDIDWRLP